MRIISVWYVPGNKNQIKVVCENGEKFLTHWPPKGWIGDEVKRWLELGGKVNPAPPKPEVKPGVPDGLAERLAKNPDLQAVVRVLADVAGLTYEAVLSKLKGKL